MKKLFVFIASIVFTLHSFCQKHVVSGDMIVTGKVGIGIATLLNKLEVNGNTHIYNSNGYHMQIGDTLLNVGIWLREKYVQQYFKPTDADSGYVYGFQAGNVVNDTLNFAKNFANILAYNPTTGTGYNFTADSKRLEMVYINGGASQSEFHLDNTQLHFTSYGHNVPFVMQYQAGDGNVGIGTSSPNSKLTVTGGDVTITDNSYGLVLKSPDGTCHRIAIANDNTIAATTITCP